MLEDNKRVLISLKKKVLAQLRVVMPYQCKFQRKFINSVVFFLKSHLNENKKEISLVKEEFPNESYTAVYDRHDLLNGKVSK